MAKIDFGGTVEEIVTREEFPLEKARQVLENEVVAVLGYGVQGPAQALNMKEIAVPAHPGISSAVGMLSADVRHDYVQTHISVSENADVSRIQSIFEDMEAQGTSQLDREGFPGPAVVNWIRGGFGLPAVD